MLIGSGLKGQGGTALVYKSCSLLEGEAGLGCGVSVVVAAVLVVCGSGSGCMLGW